MALALALALRAAGESLSLWRRLVHAAAVVAVGVAVLFTARPAVLSTAGVRGRQRVSCACACGRSAGPLPRRARPRVRHRPPPAPRHAALHARHQCQRPQ